MKFDHRSVVPLLATLIASTGVSIVDAGCPCNRGAATYSGSTLSPIPMTNSPQGMPYTGLSATGVPSTGIPTVIPPGNSYGAPTGSAHGSRPLTNMPGKVGPGYSAATKTTWQPPPGTIGETYQMESRPIPVKMHPRAAIVDVRIPGAKNVRVHDMNVYRTQDFLEGFQDDQNPDVWHFTSEPLMPRIPHIYRVEARFDESEGREMEERYVRLIMGRAIEVSF